MTDQISFPPLHDPAPAELARRRQHLIDEISREPARPRLSLARFASSRRRGRITVSARPLFVATAVVVAALALVPIGGASLGTRAVNGISSLWGTPANQPALDQAADDAQSVAGTAYYTDARVDDAANTVDVYLADAPQSIIDQLQAMHPGTYVIDNDAAHPLSQLLQVEHALSLTSLQSAGIDAVVAYPTADGYLKVGVTSESDSAVQAAQSALDSSYGAGLIQVFGGAGGVTLLPAHGRSLDGASTEKQAHR